MSKDDKEPAIHKFETVPPPDSAGAAYTAPTKVGAVTPELVGEIMHAAKKRVEDQLAEAELKRQLTADTARNKPFVDPVEEAAPHADPDADVTPPQTTSPMMT